MAEFTPSKKTAQDFNNGTKYIDGIGEIEGDVVQAESINNVIEGLLYTQGLGVNAPDVSQANQVGTVTASIITAADGSARLKFSSLKGEKGAGISTILSNGTDVNGGNKYKITLDDGREYNIVAPKGEKGNTGNGISKTEISYTTSTSGTISPASGWQSTIPTVAKGNYLWTRTVLTFNDGTSKTSYSSAYQGKDGTGSVTGIKGNAESTYRTGNVNLTPANIGAVSKSGDTMTGLLKFTGISQAIEINGNYPGIRFNPTGANHHFLFETTGGQFYFVKRPNNSEDNDWVMRMPENRSGVNYLALREDRSTVTSSSVAISASAGSVYTRMITITAPANSPLVLTVYGLETGQMGGIIISKSSSFSNTSYDRPSDSNDLARTEGEQGYWAKQYLCCTAVVAAGQTVYVWARYLNNIRYTRQELFNT